MKVHERFLNYVKFDTQSVPDLEVIPSSEKQKDLARYLVEEMKCSWMSTDMYTEQFLLTQIMICRQ